MVIRMLAVMLTMLAFHGYAWAHGALERATPKAGSVVKAAPPRISLRFSEKLEPKFSTIQVTNSAGERMDDAPTATKDGSTLEVTLKPLPPGTYKVTWRAVSVDTHASSDSYTFEVRP